MLNGLQTLHFWFVENLFFQQSDFPWALGCDVYLKMGMLAAAK